MEERDAPDEQMEQAETEMGDRLERLESELDHARDLAQERREENERIEDFTGDFEDAAPDEMIGDNAPESLDEDSGDAA